jgi:hypothetical protein
MKISDLMKKEEYYKRKLNMNRIDYEKINLNVIYINGKKWNEELMDVCGMKD